MTYPGGSTPEQRQRRRSEQSTELAAAAAISTALVLGNGDLLAEILLRVGSPTWLVRAALASKNWLRVASDPKFLDRFRQLHPQRILGLSVTSSSPLQRMFPVPQPPELAAAARLAGRTLGNLGCNRTYTDYSNGRLLVESWDSRNRSTYAVVSLLHEGRERTLPSPPPLGLVNTQYNFGLINTKYMLFLKDDGDNAMSCLCLSMACCSAWLRADFSILRSGVWGVPRSTVMELERGPTLTGEYLVSGRKVYIMMTGGCIFVLDLATATLSAIQLPDGAVHCTSLKFTHGTHSGFYLIGATGFQLCVWHGDGAGQWVLVDTISVREPACAQLDVQKWVPDDEEDTPLEIITAGDNAEFVILKLVASRIICCMQLSNRVVKKVAEEISLPLFNRFKRPITMVWPPFLPVPPSLE